MRSFVFCGGDNGNSGDTAPHNDFSVPASKSGSGDAGTGPSDRGAAATRAAACLVRAGRTHPAVAATKRSAPDKGVLSEVFPSTSTGHPQ